MPAPTLSVRRIAEASPRFKRQLKKLDQQGKSQFRATLKALLAGTLTPGRNLEKLTDRNKCYSVRLNHKQRFVFLLDDDNAAYLLAIGNHDQAYRDLPVPQRSRGNR